MQTYYTINKTKNIGFPERIIISKALYEKQSINSIAAELGFSRQTISKEISRGTYEHLNSDLTVTKMYDPYKADYYHNEVSKYKGRMSKIYDDPQLAKFITKLVKDKYSPEVIAYLIKNEFEKGNIKSKICFKTIYNWIDNESIGLTRNNLLYAKNKRKKVYKQEKNKIKPIGGESIEQRPNIDNRDEFGHWEIDCVVGKRNGKSTCLMTLVERKTRYGISMLIPKKNTKSIVNALKKLKQMYGKHFYDIFKTITADNGSEFKDAQGMSLSLKNDKKIRIYFAHAYCSWERGSNENFNRMIRRYFPKGTDFAKIDNNILQKSIDKINNYPRKIFNFKSSSELFYETLKTQFNLYN